MIVSILGAHGQIARHLTPLLVANGHTVRGLVRDDDQFDDVRSDGATPVLCDLETTNADGFDAALAGSDVVVFAAGAGPGSGPERKRTLDRDGAIKGVESAVRIGARHFVIVSSMGADDPPDDDEDFSVYLRAKADADHGVRAASIAHTIVRPGRLTDDNATGKVDIGEHVDRSSIPRRDVAAVLAEFIDEATPHDRTVELVSGDTPIASAIAQLG